MKIQAISNFITPKIKPQIKDGLLVSGYLGFPVTSIIGVDYIKEKLKKTEFSKIF